MGLTLAEPPRICNGKSLYLNYESLEEQIKKVLSEDEADESDTSTRTSPDVDKLIHANELYDRVKSLLQSDKPLDENTARIVVELSEDAIREFGNTNQEKKVELRKWRAQAESVIPPTTLGEIGKRAEGQVLKAYPKTRFARNFLLLVVGLGLIIITLIGAYKAITGVIFKARGGINSSNSATNQQAIGEPKPTATVSTDQGRERENVNAPTPSGNSKSSNESNSSVDKATQTPTPRAQN